MKVPTEVAKAYELAKKSRLKAHAPYSKFKVGATLIASNGDMISGCNVENASYGATICAERVAIHKAVSEGTTKFKNIVVVTDASTPAFPCALCLQTMAEFFLPSTTIWVGDTKEIRGSFKFSELLPHPFGPKELKSAN